jgi:hypothetical protein
MEAKIKDIQDEINSNDLSFDDIAVLFDITVQKVDLIWLDMINARRKQDEPAFYL